MGFKINLSEKNKDNIALIFEALSKECEEVEDEVLKTMQKTGKRIVENKLRNIRTDEVHKGRTKHMYQDVKTSINTDNWGRKTLKIKGGKETGTLWHIVNDGTYRTRPTHFLDESMDMIDEVTESVIDTAIKKRVDE